MPQSKRLFLGRSHTTREESRGGSWKLPTPEKVMITTNPKRLSHLKPFDRITFKENSKIRSHVRFDITDRIFFFIETIFCAGERWTAVVPQNASHAKQHPLHLRLGQHGSSLHHPQVPPQPLPPLLRRLLRHQAQPPAPPSPHQRFLAGEATRK